MNQRLKRPGFWSAAACFGLSAVLLASFDPNSLKPRIAEAVKQATGRDLSLTGNLSLKWSLRPTIALHGAALANPPGFSRPQMASLQELDLQLALVPLLSRRIEIERLVLVHPDILLETDAQGHHADDLTRLGLVPRW